MFRIILKVPMWLIWLGSPAFSGAWLQEQGGALLALSTTSRVSEDGSYSYAEGTAYFEMGATPALTFGADLNATGDDYGHAIAFMRRPLARADGQNRMAFELGFGARYQISVWDPVIKLGLSFGRGIETGIGYGWLTLDSALEVGMTNSDVTAKLDAAWGMPLTDRLKSLLQIETTHWPDTNSSIGITPSLLWEFRSDRFLQLGLEARQSTTDTFGIKVGLWRKF